MASGRSGLSLKQRPAPLLSVVGGKPVAGVKSKAKLIQPVEFDAAPLSSDDEDEASRPAGIAGPSRSAQSPTRSSDSEPENSSRGTIKRTNFGTADASKSRKRGTRNASYSRSNGLGTGGSGDGSSSKSKRRKLDDSDGQGPASNKSSQPKSISSSADHLTDQRGFTKKQAVRSTYGKKYGSSQDSLSKLKVKSENARPRAKIKEPDSLDSPKKPARAKLCAPSDSILSSPSKAAPARFIKQSQGSNEGSEDPLDSPIRKTAIRKKVVQASKQKKSGTVWNPLRPPVQKPPKFLIPAEIPDCSQESREGDDGNPKNPRSSLSGISDLSDISDLEGLGNSQSVTEASYAGEGDCKVTEAECPWCGDAVPDALLKEFSKGKRLNVRMQTKFCQTHKKQTAMDTWREKQYPAEILWPDLQSRFEDHRDFLLEVVSGEPSHFRSILAKKIETGKARSLKKEDNLNPGYYGPRGFNLMCDYLVGEFGDLLKEKAVSDRVIAGRGSASFIESVLVAELAVRLIQEDMDVSTEEARDIMEESKALGEMIHEEV